MAKAMLVCGKIASGKSWYCRSLMEESPALLLSVDGFLTRPWAGTMTRPPPGFKPTCWIRPRKRWEPERM